LAFWRWAEERIQAAMQAGDFDSLAGKGEPVNIDVDPLTPPEERLARHVMQNAGVKPAWVELADDIQAQTEDARAELVRTAESLPPGDAGRERAFDRFDRRVEEINLLIKHYNLMVPNPRLARPLLVAAVECDRLLDPSASDD
jgi:hypothetical protein